MIASERAYRMLLRAYPLSFRSRFESEMLLAFRDQRRTSGSGAMRFWFETLWDIARSAPGQRAESWRDGWTTPLSMEGRTMKPMAIVAILVGALEIVNALAEGWLGGVTNHDTRSLAAGVLGLVAGSLLIVAGAAVLGRAPASAPRARNAAVACLGLLAITALMGRLSILSIVLGVAISIALLLVLRGARPAQRQVAS
jgi:hypothetical protein